MDTEVIQAAKMAEEESHSENATNVRNVSQELKNISPEIRDLLDIFAKQNKQDNEQDNNSDFENIEAKKVLACEELQSKEYLTLYATNDEASTEPQVIQLTPASNDYSAYFDSSHVEMSGLKSYQIFNIDPSQVENAHPTFISPKTDPPSYSIHLAKSDAETSLNSSGYASANSPIESIANSPADSVNSHKEPESQLFSSIPSHDHDPLSMPSSKSIMFKNSSSSNPYKIPVWVRQVYPELYQIWESLSANEFYQGGVELVCSICEKNPYSGFHENLPVCEADRVGRACTVCRMRSSSGFSYGLALCEADRLFLYRTFSRQTKFDRCVSLCPVTVQKWCGYCRFRTCLSTKGFKFFTQASTKHLIDQEPYGDSRKRKYSGEGIVKELNFIPDSVEQDSIFIPNASSPGPGFAVPATVQAQQALANANSYQSNPTILQPNLRQSLIEANPVLKNFLSQPSITPRTSLNQTPVANFLMPRFNLRPGMSKAEIASSAPPSTYLGRAVTQPNAGVQFTAYSQQSSSSQGRAFTPFPPFHPRATASTQIPHSLRDQNLAFIPPSSAQMRRYGSVSQLPQSLELMQQQSGNPLLTGCATPFPQPSAVPGRSTSLANTRTYPTPQPRFHRPQSYSLYPHQVRQPIPEPYFNGFALGTRNKGTGAMGVLMDPNKQEWVREQQEKYLNFHLRLYRARRK